MTYKEFREMNPLPRALELSSSLCYPFSPFLSIFFIRHGVRPNTVTLLMMVMGVVAGTVLMLPYAWAKILAGFLYFIWYTLDLSDGEVARFTKVFSKGGKYLDWCAHLVTHPLFAIGMWQSFISLGYDALLITIITFSFISIELIGRDRLSMSTLLEYDNDKTDSVSEPQSLSRYIYSCFYYLPNILIFFPLMLGISMFFSFTWFYWVYVAWVVFYCFFILRLFICFVNRLYKS